MVLTLKFTLRMTYQWKLSPYLGWASQHHGTKKQNDHKMSPIYGRIYYHVEGLWNGISLSIWINKDITGINLQMWMGALKREHNAWDPADAATPHSDCWRDGCLRGEERCENKKKKKKKKKKGHRILLQIAEVHMKGMNSVSPEACIFPHIEEC